MNRKIIREFFERNHYELQNGKAILQRLYNKDTNSTVHLAITSFWYAGQEEERYHYSDLSIEGNKLFHKQPVCIFQTSVAPKEPQ